MQIIKLSEMASPMLILCVCEHWLCTCNPFSMHTTSLTQEGYRERREYAIKLIIIKKNYIGKQLKSVLLQIQKLFVELLKQL